VINIHFSSCFIRYGAGLNSFRHYTADLLGVAAELESFTKHGIRISIDCLHLPDVRKVIKEEFQ
jgi:hypothetical protein